LAINNFPSVIPAKAGIHKHGLETLKRVWIPAPDQVEGRLFAGMTQERYF